MTKAEIIDEVSKLPLAERLLIVDAILETVQDEVDNQAVRVRRSTLQDLLDSGLVGLWQDRDDITDSAAFARQLREQAQKRK